MSRFIGDVDHWVRWGKWVCYRHRPGDQMVPVVGLEQKRMAESRGCVRPFRGGATLGLVLRVLWEENEYFHGESLP